MITSNVSLNLCVLASGKGSNLNSIISAQKSHKINSKVALVISNNSGSDALNTARANQIPAVHLSQKLFKTEKEFETAFLKLFKEYKIDLIILAGYMKLLSREIIEKYRNRILNIHPALLPSFSGHGMYGLKVHEEVLKHGAKITGATVHFVDEVYDNGPVILQEQVKVSDNDTPETLREKVLKLEHKLYPEAIRLIETGKINIQNGSHPELSEG